MSGSLRPHGLRPTRLLCPWGSPGKNTGVGFHDLLQEIFLTQGSNPHLSCLLLQQVDSLPLAPPGKSPSSVQFSSVAPSCPTLGDPMNRSTPGLPVYHQLPEFTQTHVHWVSDAIRPSHPLSSPSPPAPPIHQQIHLVLLQNKCSHFSLFHSYASERLVCLLLGLFKQPTNGFQLPPDTPIVSALQTSKRYLFLN